MGDAAGQTEIQIEFEPPGPGAWALDRSHYPGGVTPISEWLLRESMPAGMGRVMAELGAPVRDVAAGFVNGFMYTRVRPLLGADRPATRTPPAPLLWLGSRLHPEFRRRARSATATLRDRPSLAVAERWERVTKPELVAANRAFQDVDPETLDDQTLQVHLRALLDHLRANFELHFWLHGHDLGPIARYLHLCIGQGLDPAQATAALAGASPSTLRPLVTLHHLRQAIEAAGVSVDDLHTLDDVRSASPEAAELLDGYLAEHGHVLVTGYDLTDLTLIELPRLVLESIRTAAAPRPADHERVAGELREQVPTDGRAEFDEALREARSVMDMRDDNGPLTVEWPAGLLRRSLLAAGRRLAERGEIADPTDVLEVTPDEARRLFESDRPAADEFVARRTRRRELATLEPPVTLGPPEPEPPLHLLPEPLAELVGMIQVAFAHLGMDGAATVPPADNGSGPGGAHRDATGTGDGPGAGRRDVIDAVDAVDATDTAVGADDAGDTPAAGRSWSGVGVGAGTLVGRARTARSADEAIELLEPGDILVVRATSPAFNAVLAIAGGVVTADGGAMSHAAVLARELGIPAVIGAAGALEIPDGSTVEVDAAAGRVRII